MATSIGAGISAGLQQGTGIARQFENDKRLEEDRAERKQERELARADRDRLQRRQDEQYEQGKDDRDYKLLDDERTRLRGQYESLVQQYGGFEKVPKEQVDALNQTQGELATRLEAAQRRRFAPMLERERGEAGKLLAGLKSGQVKAEDIPDGELFRAIGVITRRDPRDLLRDQTGSSTLGAALQGLMEQIETPMGDAELAKAANIILAPELSQGVGSPGRDGAEIIKKEIERLVPSPDGKRMLPVLRVTVRRPDGATGSYLAPVTASRSSSADDDDVTQLDLGAAMDYAGGLATLEQLANIPGVREKLERGAQSKPDVDRLEQFRQGYASVGAKPVKRKIKIEERKLGATNEYITRDQDTGEQIGKPEVRNVTMTPDQAERNRVAGIRASRPPGARGIQVTLEAIDGQVEDGEITEEEGRQLKQDALRSAAARGAGRGSGDRPLSETQVAARVKNAEQEAAKSNGLTWSADRKAWIGKDGKKATEEQLNKVNEAGVRARREADRLTATGKANAPKVDDATKQRLNAMREKAGLPPL